MSKSDLNYLSQIINYMMECRGANNSTACDSILKKMLLGVCGDTNRGRIEALYGLRIKDTKVIRLGY